MQIDGKSIHEPLKLKFKLTKFELPEAARLEKFSGAATSLKFYYRCGSLQQMHGLEMFDIFWTCVYQARNFILWFICLIY